MTKTQTAVAALALAALPLIWQGNLQAQASGQREDVARRTAQILAELEALEDQARQQMARTRIVQAERMSAERQRAQQEEELAGRKPKPVYRWDDMSPLARVPKAVLARIPLSSVNDRRGTLNDRVAEALQFTESERRATQDALHRFLASYQAAESERMLSAPAREDDLQGRTPEQVRVFEVKGMAEALGGLRKSFFDELTLILGPERFALFQKGMGDWMALDDEFRGINTGQAVLNADYRMRFYEPEPGGRMIAWSMHVEQHGSLFVTVDVDDLLGWLPGSYQGRIADWIELARMEVQTEPGLGVEVPSKDQP